MCVRAHLHVCACACTHAYAHARTHEHTRVRTRAHTCACTCTCTHTHTYTPIHVCTGTYAHAHARTFYTQCILHTHSTHICIYKHSNPHIFVHWHNWSTLLFFYSCITASVTCGHYHTFARSIEGTLYGWGKNANGQLGIGTVSVLETTPKKLLLNAQVQHVAAGPPPPPPSSPTLSGAQWLRNWISFVIVYMLE